MNLNFGQLYLDTSFSNEAPLQVYKTLYFTYMCRCLKGEYKMEVSLTSSPLYFVSAGAAKDKNSAFLELL
jgi:hypothetical protein